MSYLKQFTDLDFNSIRSNLRTYLESQDTLKDYNFDGSVSSVLLDILAFNTMYNAVYANMTASERFLSTAQLRSSVVALAKNLGYVPRSVKAAKATITLTVEYTGSGSAPSSILLPAGSKFTGKNSNNRSLVFFNRDNVYLENTSGSLYSASFDIYEGKSFIYKETIDAGQEGVIIPNTGIDTELLTVNLRPSPGSTTFTTLEKVNSFVDATNQSNIYFVEEVDGERHRIYFGDGSMGQQVSQGQEIEIQYYKSSGTEGNSINSFSFSDAPTDTRSVSVSVNSISSGGSDIESIDSIRNTAPLFYQAQNRAVTARDYEAIVTQQFTDIQDIAVWGGEDATPPSYGKVFIAAVPKFGEFISETRKNEIENILKDEYSIMTIEADLVDPEYLYIELENEIRFSSAETSTSAQEIKTQATTKINEYENTNLKAFNKNFRLSKLSSEIDSVNTAISSNTFTLKMSIRPPDLEDVSKSNELSFGNQVEAGTLTTEQFEWSGFSNVFLEDNKNGDIEIYRAVSGIKTPINNDIGNVKVAGTINYETGKIVLNPNVFNVLDVSRIYNKTLNIKATPVLNDIFARQRKVIRLCNDELSIRVVDTVTGISI